MKKFLIFTLAIFLVGIFVSCTMNNDENSVSVGTILVLSSDDDEDAIPTQQYKKADNIDENDTPIGIVAFIGDGTVGEKGVAYIMGLTFKENLKWAASESAGLTTNFKEIYCKSSTKSATTATFEGDTDGSDNYTEIKSVTSAITVETTDGDDNTTTSPAYPIFNYAESYSIEDINGWYIPTVAELSSLFKNRTVIQEAIKKLESNGASVPSFTDSTTSTAKTFWTSSIPYDDIGVASLACAITFNSDGEITYKEKSKDHSALVIHKFE